MPRPGTDDFAEAILDDQPNNQRDLLRRIFAWLSVELVLDVGAYTGDFAEYLRREVGYEWDIICFEPDPDSFESLVSRSHRDGAWAVENVAVGAVQGTGQLNRFDRANLNSLHPQTQNFVKLFESSAIGSVSVRVETLKSYLDERQVDRSSKIFLKVDAQGHDWEVIEGLESRIGQVVALQVEIPVLHLYQGVTHWTETLEKLESLGFWVAGIFPVSRDPGLLRIVEFDAVLVRDL